MMFFKSDDIQLLVDLARFLVAPLGKMLIADNKAISIFALFRIWIIDATLVLHKILHSSNT